MLNDYAVTAVAATTAETTVRKPLITDGYTAEVDCVTEQTWHELLAGFDDANIYQSWAYGAVIAANRNISRLMVRKAGEVVAIAQVRIAKLPFTNTGIAYVLWGPLWRRSGRNAAPETFRHAMRALRQEYVVRRGLSLRVSLQIVANPEGPFTRILEEEGFSAAGQKTGRTVLMNLEPPLEAIRNGMKAHWKRELKVAEKNALEIVEGTGDDLFEQFIAMYREMVARKRFVEPNDIEQFRAIQQRLPHGQKMRILLGQSGGVICAGAIYSAMGDTAVYLFGATSNAGMKSRGSYVLQWRVIEDLKRQHTPVYDLNGINPETNPGTFKFKTDLAGENGRDVRFLGTFDAQGRLPSRLCVAAWSWLKGIRGRMSRLSQSVRKLRAQGSAPRG